MPTDARGFEYVTMTIPSRRARGLGEIMRDEILHPKREAPAPAARPAPTPQVRVTPEGAYVDGELVVERSSPMSWSEAGAALARYASLEMQRGVTDYRAALEAARKALPTAAAIYNGISR